MHRVLSYQTAMSASTGRDVREYVTKRTCVSLILTIAFFTLISGFLLGKFVADRQYHIKYFRDTDLRVLKDLVIARNVLASAANEAVQHSNTSVHNELNTNIFLQYTNCMSESPQYNLRLDAFIDAYIIHTIAQQGICFGKLSDFLRNNVEKEAQPQLQLTDQQQQQNPVPLP